MADLDPRAHDCGYGTVSTFACRHETPEQRAERRSRNTTALVIAAVAALVLLALFVAAVAALDELHAAVSGLTG
ncbi:MAG: hypothetical protein ACRDNW_07080 [Trebonia sp.]